VIECKPLLVGPRWMCSDDLGRYTMDRGNSKVRQCSFTGFKTRVESAYAFST